MLDREPHLRYHAKLVEVHMTFQKRGGTYKWTSIIHKIKGSLEKKIKTKVSLDKVYIGFPNSLVMENLYLKGQNIDTLLAVKKFDVGLDMWKLMSSKADITSIDLEGVRANVVRDPKGKFKLHINI